jgi:predicted aspartyl protease
VLFELGRLLIAFSAFNSTWYTAHDTIGLMGLTYVEGTVRAPGSRRQRAKRVRFLIDSGAIYSVLRRNDWMTLGLRPERELEFVLADGSTLTRGVSECTFEIEGRRATSPVVLGETEDEALMGAVTLETLGLMLNPLSRTLQPMRMVLARARH